MLHAVIIITEGFVGIWSGSLDFTWRKVNSSHSVINFCIARGTVV